MKKSMNPFLAMTLLTLSATAYANPGHGPDFGPRMDHERVCGGDRGPFMRHPDGGPQGRRELPPPPPAFDHRPHGRHGGPGMKPGMGPMPLGFEHLLKAVDLTTDQQIAMDKEFGNMISKGAEAKASLAEAHHEMGKLLAAVPVDKAAVLALQDKIMGYEKSLLANKLDHDIAVFNILTAEQQAKVKEMLNHRPGDGPAPDEHKKLGCQCGTDSAEQMMPPPPPPDGKGKRGRK